MTALRATERRRTAEPGSMSVLTLAWRARSRTVLHSAARAAVDAVLLVTVRARRGL